MKREKIIQKVWLILLMGLLFWIPQKGDAAAASVNVNMSVKYGQTEARSILNMINTMRTGSDAWYWNSSNTAKIKCNNLQKLQYDYDLERVAMQRAAEIAVLFDHIRPNNTWCMSALDGISWWMCGENIAYGQTTAAKVNAVWREDKQYFNGQGHRRNMLSDGFNCVGIGHAYYNGRHYWVEEFAWRDDINTTVTTANNSNKNVTVEVDTSNISGFTAKFDKSEYVLNKEESAAVTVSGAKVTVNGKSLPVSDKPEIYVENSKIASGTSRITGLAEGTTRIYANLYGMKSSNYATVKVHNFSKIWTTDQAAKCEKAGSKSYHCLGCSARRNVTAIPATGHKWDAGRITKKPTTRATGIKTYTCTKCKKTRKAKLNKLVAIGKTITDSKTGNQYKVTGNKEGSRTVAFKGNKKAAVITIPETVKIDGEAYKVTEISANALKNRTKVRNVTIGTNVKKIGSKAFYGCKNLNTLTIRTTLLTMNSVGKDALKGTGKKLQITVPQKQLTAYTVILKARGLGSGMVVKAGQF